MPRNMVLRNLGVWINGDTVVLTHLHEGSSPFALSNFYAALAKRSKAPGSQPGDRRFESCKRYHRDDRHHVIGQSSLLMASWPSG